MSQSPTVLEFGRKVGLKLKFAGVTERKLGLRFVDWNVLIDEVALAALLPAGYANFARPVKEGLVVFLSGLPTAIQKSIMTEQATLPATATLSERLGLLARGCPVLHKLGQVLARDQRLAEELRRELRPLESLPPSTNFETIRAILAEELGPLESRGITLLGPAIAEASVAVVIPFRDTGSGSPHDGVFKVLKPGIEERLELELELLGRVGSHLDEQCAELSIPQLDYRDTFEQVRDKLRWEIRLDQEQRHLVEAAAFYKDDVDVQIPALLDHCTSRVTAMERVFGVKVTDHGLDCAVDKRRLAELVSRVLVAQTSVFATESGDVPLRSSRGKSALHARRTSGNSGLELDRPSQRIGADRHGTDHSERHHARCFADRGRVSGTQHAAAGQPVGLACVVDNWLRRVRCGQLPGLTWLVGMLDEATQSARLRVGPDLMMFRKSLHTLEGVVNDLGAEDAEIEKTLLGEFVIQFGKEWPERWFSLPTSRAFATRLSNIDITATILSLPLAVARFWQAEWLDVLRKQPLATTL